MVGKRSPQDKLVDGKGEVNDQELHPQQKVLKGSHSESFDCHSEPRDPKPGMVATSSDPGKKKQDSFADVSKIRDENLEIEENLGSAMIASDDDEESLESNVGSDMLTNVEGQLDWLLPTKPKLTGVKIVADDAAENVGMKNVARLLRRQRYHDDDISQPATAPRMSMSRCFRCLLPGHLARDCPNPAKEKPCTYCAGYGHLQSQCPKSLCFRCNGFGHVLGDCKLRETKTTSRICIRCGKRQCPASGGMDWYRVHGGCRQEYSESDLRHIRCFVCGQQGHFCCEDTPLEPTFPSCCNCGRDGHTGLANACPDVLPPFLIAEAAQANRLRESSAHPQHARSSGRDASGAYDRSGRSRDGDSGRQHGDGPRRLDTGRDGLGYQIRQDHDWRHARGGGAVTQTPHVGLAQSSAGNCYGPQRYGYGPAAPQPAIQNPSNHGHRRRGFHAGPPAQHHVHSSGPALPAVVTHPPPDVVSYGSVNLGGHYTAHNQGNLHGGHQLTMQSAQGWHMQHHDISAQRYQRASGASGGATHIQQPHLGQPQYVRQDDAPYYTPNANGQGTHRRWP